MTLDSLKESDHVIGMKQVQKAVKRGSAAQVFLAEDADAWITSPIQKLCEEHEIPVMMAGTMKDLGKACGIEVGAAAAAVLA